MGPGQIFVIRVSHQWLFHLKITNFQFFTLRVKKSLTYLIKKYPGQSRVSVLFTAGQKYSRVGSGQGPSLAKTPFY